VCACFYFLTEYHTVLVKDINTPRAMNRYGRGPSIGGTSKATASTLCQKCLKRGHYSYECKAVAQERPYVSRPSRTQQLLNPKLVPKLTSDIPQELLRKKGVADEQLAKAELERGRKRERQSEDPDEIRGAPKRMRSASTFSASASTISTDLSRSLSPRATSRDSARRKARPSSMSRSPPHREFSRNETRSLTRSPSVSRSPPPRVLADSEKKRRRDSFSSIDSYTSEDPRNSKERAGSRSTRRRFQQISPPARGRRTESRSPNRGSRRRLSNDRQRGDRFSDGGLPRSDSRPPPRERNLSPFSRRLALTQAMNMGR